MSIMSALDSPMEALAINYMSYGVFTAVNNVWAWIAVVTAAISFWKIKSSVVSPSPRTSPINHSSSSSNLLLGQPQSQSPETLPSVSGACFSPSSSMSKRIKNFSPLESTIGTTSGKFTVYYKKHEDDDVGDLDVMINGADVTEEKEMMRINGGCVERNKYGSSDGWEAVLRMKSPDKEWYRYQDLTVLDGNVVRLWDCNNNNHAYSSSTWTTGS